MAAPVLGRTLVVLAGAAAALTTCFWLAEVLVVLLEEVLVVLLEEELEEELPLSLLTSWKTGVRVTQALLRHLQTLQTVRT